MRREPHPRDELGRSDRDDDLGSIRGTVRANDPQDQLIGRGPRRRHRHGALRCDPEMVCARVPVHGERVLDQGLRIGAAQSEARQCAGAERRSRVGQGVHLVVRPRARQPANARGQAHRALVLSSGRSLDRLHLAPTVDPVKAGCGRDQCTVGQGERTHGAGDPHRRRARHDRALKLRRLRHEPPAFRDAIPAEQQTLLVETAGRVGACNDLPDHADARGIPGRYARTGDLRCAPRARIDANGHHRVHAKCREGLGAIRKRHRLIADDSAIARDVDRVELAITIDIDRLVVEALFDQVVLIPLSDR